MPLDLAALAPEIGRFAAHLASERRSSPHTSRAYLADLASYAAWLAGQGVPLASAPPAAVRGFLAHASETCGPVALGRKVSNSEAFTGTVPFFERAGFVTQDTQVCYCLEL